jgi:hypothetical protein
MKRLEFLSHMYTNFLQKLVQRIAIVSSISKISCKGTLCVYKPVLIEHMNPILDEESVNKFIFSHAKINEQMDRD